MSDWSDRLSEGREDELYWSAKYAAARAVADFKKEYDNG